MNKEIANLSLVAIFLLLLINVLVLKTSALAVNLLTPETIKTVGNKTFYVSPQKYGEGATWADALTYCQRAGFILASIETTEERKVVSDFLLKDFKDPNSINNVWTAGTDFFTEGEWYWLSSRLPVDFSVSKTSEAATEGPWYNCLYLGAAGDLKSNYCDFNKARALCETPSSAFV